MPFVAQPTPQTARDRPFNVAAVAKDGIQLIAISRVTVRTNIDRLVGGAGEETVIARVGEGMVSTIGSAATHKNVLENPDHISKHILSKGLDAGTAYEILSVATPWGAGGGSCRDPQPWVSRPQERAVSAGSRRAGHVGLCDESQ